MKPKVLFFSTLQLWRGAEKFWSDAVLDSRFRDEFDCHVMLRDNDAVREWASRLVAAGVTVKWWHDAPGSVVQRAWNRLARGHRQSELGRYQAWRNQIMSLRPALVWFNISGIGAIRRLGLPASTCADLGIPYWLVIQHAQDHFFLENDDERVKCESVVMQAARVVCVALQNLRILELAVGRRLDNIFTGVNALPHDFITRAAAAAAANPVRTEGEARFLCLGQFLLGHKGQHILLEALAGKQWIGRHWGLTLVGGGPHSGHMARLIEYYGIPSDRVQVCGYSNDVISVIADSDLLVMPSLSEGMPYTMVEAMACGRPAVGTPVGGIPEIVVEGETGWLARSTETADFAEALERAWGDRSNWPRYGTEARLRVSRKYDQQNTHVQLISAIKQDIEKI